MRDFEEIVARLWTHLGLGDPRFDGGGQAIVLRVDDRALTLRLSPDERHVLVSGVAGRLADDPPLRLAQADRLLRESAAMVLSSGATVCFAPGDAPSPELVVVGTAPCRRDGVADLVRTVEEVLRMLDIHAAGLQAGRGAPVQGRMLAADLAADSVIIRL